MNEKIKYPRTLHVPWSLGIRPCDRVHTSMDSFKGKEIVVSYKMDGESCTMYNDIIHARSINSSNHPTRDWVKNFHGKIKYDIPDGWRICGENMFATHSIKYNSLPSFFLGFSIWNEYNTCLNWDSTMDFFDLLGIRWVPTIFRGTFEKLIEQEWIFQVPKNNEGYVIRWTQEFTYGQFHQAVGKFVRENHVQTDEHWMYDKSIHERNQLK